MPAKYQVFYSNPDEPRFYSNQTFEVVEADSSEEAKQSFGQTHPRWMIESVKEMRHTRRSSNVYSLTAL